MKIDQIIARTILDTRGRETVETTLSAGGVSATASIPSGKSVGMHEAVELRDEDGGVAGAVGNVNGEIAEELVGNDFASLDVLDTFLIDLDGTKDKSRLGANAILSVSIAAMRLSALLDDVPLWRAIAKRSGLQRPASPRLFINVLNGGAHADFKLPFQEYLLVVEGARGGGLSVVKRLFEKLGEHLGTVAVGDEGGYAPILDTLEAPFELLTQLIGDTPGVTLALDAAASEFYRDGAYHILNASYSADELFSLYEKLLSRFPLVSIEDPFEENAHADFIRFTHTFGEKILVVGDDLTVTNPVRVASAIGKKEINAVLVKPNQVGTVREAILAVEETRDAGFKVIASHRSGETADTFIADFAYGVGAYGLKAGGLAQKERLVKYDRLNAIEAEARHTSSVSGEAQAV